MACEPTPEVIKLGLAATSSPVFGIWKEREFGRGERDGPATNDLPITMRLAQPPEPCDLIRST